MRGIRELAGSMPRRSCDQSRGGALARRWFECRSVPQSSTWLTPSVRRHGYVGAVFNSASSFASADAAAAVARDPDHLSRDQPPGSAISSIRSTSVWLKEGFSTFMWSLDSSGRRQYLDDVLLSIKTPAYRADATSGAAPPWRRSTISMRPRAIMDGRLQQGARGHQTAGVLRRRTGSGATCQFLSASCYANATWQDLL
jgi:aminopeptidase N